MYETLAIAAIVLTAGLLQGLTGFGFGLVALPLLSLFIPLKTIIPLITLLALIICIYLSIELRKSIRLHTIKRLFWATLPGVPLGVYALKHLPATYLSIALGVIMVAFTGYQLIMRPKPREFGNAATAIAGFSCGFLGGSIAAGGPPVIIYATMQPWPKDETKATLAFYFLISGLCIAASQLYAQLVTSEVLHYFAITSPALVIGIIFGSTLYKHVSDKGYRTFAMSIVFILGLMMIYKNI